MKSILRYLPNKRLFGTVPSTSASSTGSSSSGLPNVVLVEGVRTPFALSGTLYANLLGVDLARSALKGLITKTALDPKTIDYITLGTVIQEGKLYRIKIHSNSHPRIIRKSGGVSAK